MTEEHIIQRLHRLRRLVDYAISGMEAGQFIPCTPEEGAEHTKTFGADAMTLGDFVITDRKAPPRSALGDSGAFEELLDPARPSVREIDDPGPRP